MSVPKDILAIPRPKNTRVKPSGNHYLVIKRTCKRIGGRNVPVELGVIGEIRDGRYIERINEPVKREIDIKDYGEVALLTSSERIRWTTCSRFGLPRKRPASIR